MWLSKARLSYVIGGLAAALLALGLSSCSMGRSVSAEANAQRDVTAGVVKVVRKTLTRELTLSSELVPFQVAAKHVQPDAGSGDPAVTVADVVLLPKDTCGVVPDMPSENPLWSLVVFELAISRGFPD